MENNQVKGKTGSMIGLIISVLTILLAAAVFYIASKGNYERIFVLVAGGLAVLCLIALLLSYKGSLNMKRSGASNMTGKMGVILSSIALIASLGLIGICATTETKQNDLFNEKEFDKEKAGMDSLLNSLNSAGDTTTHKDSISK